jgi:hypothetical protein
MTTSTEPRMQYEWSREGDPWPQARQDPSLFSHDWMSPPISQIALNSFQQACLSHARVTSAPSLLGPQQDVDSPPPARRELDIAERDLVGRLAKRQEHLKECLDMMRSTTKGYRDELNRASADYTSGLAQPQCDGLASVLVHRLGPVHARLREHAAAVHDLCAALDPGGAGMLAIGPAPDDKQGAATAGGVERGGYAAAAPPPAVEVSAVPVFTGQGGAVDVTKLLYKICKYRDDADIEEGMCARLGSVLEDAMPQVCVIEPPARAKSRTLETSSTGPIKTMFHIHSHLRIFILSPPCRLPDCHRRSPNPQFSTLILENPRH